MSKRKIAITLIKSWIGQPAKHRLVIKGVGLKRIHHTVIRSNTPEIRGMVQKISHLVAVKEVDQK